jgi:hypothetical protein
MPLIKGGRASGTWTRTPTTLAVRLVERARTKAKGTPRAVMRAREIVAQLTDIHNEGKSPGVEKPL